MLGIGGSTYLELLDALDIEVGLVSETSEWPLLIIGAAGTGSVLVSSWKESRSRRRRRRLLPRR